jgi:hypothetical protein
MGVAPVQPAVLDAFLSAGGWSDNAVENLALGERLPTSFVRNLVTNYKAAPADRVNVINLGLLVLGAAVAEWGVEPDAGLPPDPQEDGWEGPDSHRGKHLMSYSIGGVGVAHADVGYLSKFLAYLTSAQATRFSDSENKLIKSLVPKLAHGMTYDDLRNAGGSDWETFTHCILSALRLRDAQAWLIGYFLENYWLESYDAIMASKLGTVEEALINARIRNSGPGLADCALKHARSPGIADSLQAQLDAYGDPKICKGAKTRHQDRAGYMKRAVVLYRFF